MAGLKYEQNLPHQEGAISAVMNLFDGVGIRENTSPSANPLIDFYGKRQHNILLVQQENGIPAEVSEENVFDIMMETGTGKTYTYTKTMFELHQKLGVFKFVIVVPTLSIKAGTKAFLESNALRQHFKQDFGGRYEGAEIALYLVESKKSKGKDNSLGVDFERFLNATDKKKIHVLLINQAMITSKSMQEQMMNGQLWLELYDYPTKALASLCPVVIVDEPHRFKTDKTTWQQMQGFNALFTLRYGATFPRITPTPAQKKKGVKEKIDYKNLIYHLSAVDAFNQNLVKGIRVFCSEVENVSHQSIRLMAYDNNEATFKMGKEAFTFSKGESLQRMHSALGELSLLNVKKNKGVELSNGKELKMADSISPYSYAPATTQQMMKEALKVHFELEKDFLSREVKIKPLTLFFIDNIDAYRQESGWLRQTFENLLKEVMEETLKACDNDFYRNYLKKSLKDLSQTHGGYFSKDLTDKTDGVEKEVAEILYDKESLLNVKNPRRFIFSMWTLREGWDNPNVFTICKLRSSGSEISKLQEVGRGLRLPVNQYMSRIKSTEEIFYLNYFVDVTEKDFTDQLVKEVNSRGLDKIEEMPTKLTDELIEKIKSAYPFQSNFKIMSDLINEKIINEDQDFIDGEKSYLNLKATYPLAFKNEEVQKNKIQNGNDKKPKRIAMRQGKYEELKTLWEQIHQKVLLEYDFKDETHCQALLETFLMKQQPQFRKSLQRIQQYQSHVENDRLTMVRINPIEEDFIPLQEMDYPQFVEKLALGLSVKLSTLHRAFCHFNIKELSPFFNQHTLERLTKGFNDFLLMNAFQRVNVSYQKLSHQVHPTAFTNDFGEEKTVKSSDLGRFQESGNPIASYLFDQIFYDSDLELYNIAKEGEIEGVTVFTKIPKNSIRIPCTGGKTYSPDFIYILKTKRGEVLNCIIETKNVNNMSGLREEEKIKIQHAEHLFNQVIAKSGLNFKIKFETQFSDQKITEILKKALSEE